MHCCTNSFSTSLSSKGLLSFARSFHKHVEPRLFIPEGKMAANVKTRASAAIDASSQELYELSSEIWRNPELGFKEYKAHELLTSFLEKKRFAVERSFTGIETSLVPRPYATTPHGPCPLVPVPVPLVPVTWSPGPFPLVPVP